MVKILVVDDDPIIRHVFVKILPELGYTPTTASHGQEALDCLAVQPIDLVLTDIQMPILDGIELIARIRTTPQWVNLPILVVTATPPGHEQRHVLYYVNGILLKPFNISDLAQTINKILNHTPIVK